MIYVENISNSFLLLYDFICGPFIEYIVVMAPYSTVHEVKVLAIYLFSFGSDSRVVPMTCKNSKRVVFIW